MQATDNATRTVIVQPGVNATPTAVWRAAREQRDELRSQLDNLEDQRRSLAQQIEEGGVTGQAKTGIETRIAEIDKRIADLDKQVSEASSNVAKAAGVPGAVQPDPRPIREGPPEEVFVLGGIFIFVCLLPISIAYARRIWRKSAAAVAAIPGDLMERLNRLDQAVDSIAVEVERIGEGQRFVTRLMSERAGALGAGAAQQVDVGARENLGVKRETR
jgi:hypothetical protein